MGYRVRIHLELFPNVDFEYVFLDLTKNPSVWSICGIYGHVDWETVKTKYDEIVTRFQAKYPKADSGVIPDEYPNCERPEKINKAKIAPKIKCITANFRKAVDSGRKSGGGRIVMALYDECHEIWSGSPAVHCNLFLNRDGFS